MPNEKFPLALPEGTVLAGQFIIDEVLGQGGFGITYKATDHKSGEKVAIKEYYPDTMVSRSETTVIPYTGEREENFKYGLGCFLREAETLAKYVDNDGIVSIRSYFEENGTAYFVMDFVEGVSFDQYIKDKGGKIEYEDAKNVLLPIIDALAAVHKDGIVHRDVTPDNIFITKDGAIKLLDFGAARYSIGDKSRSLDVVLKHGYAPKEQYTRHGKQGPFTDIYTVGVCFYRAITGKLPVDSIDRLEEDDVVPPSTLGVKIEPHEEDAILKAMAVQPADRFKSMEEFKAALIGTTDEPVKEEAPATPVENITAQEIKTIADGSTDNVETKKKSKISKPVIIFAIVAAVLLLLFLSWSHIVRGIDYIKAGRYVAEGNYPQAIEVYEKYNDSEKVSENAYQYAVDCLNLKNDLDEGPQLIGAINYFEKAGDYKDSKEKLKEAKYRYGYHLFEEAEYDSAIKYLKDLDNYSPGAEYEKSDELLKACNYLKACELYESGEYDAALEIFSQLGSYYWGDGVNSSKMVNECNYQKAVALLEEGDEGGYEILMDLYDYTPINSSDKKPKDLLGDYLYEVAENYISEGYYEDAIEILEELKSQGEDVEDLLLSAKYGYVHANYNSSNTTTKEYLDELVAAEYNNAQEDWAELYGWIKILGIRGLECEIESDNYGAWIEGVQPDTLYSPDEVWYFYYIKDSVDDAYIVKTYKNSDEMTNSERYTDDGEYQSWYWSTGAGPTAWEGTNTLTIKIFDLDGHLLDQESITISND